ncbi:hypothetical protein BRADI_3g47364v3 [Brachypodium distachyon]|uniref:Uncharacterized protein n=1 Tax=Brachypodium distachyon TaxID=15368 RepID=A0A2K2D3W0_BRADI|nr:hypothetical protein BRADI_3g47364v3 [Brachypodium distachyon]
MALGTGGLAHGLQPCTSIAVQSNCLALVAIVGSLLASHGLTGTHLALAAAVTDATAEAPRPQALNGGDLRVTSPDGAAAATVTVRHHRADAEQ